MRRERRWPWQSDDPLATGPELSPGWALALVMAVLFAVGLGSLWVADMHHYGYGLFAR